MLEGDEIFNQGIEEERKTDIMYAGVHLAKALKSQAKDPALVESIRKWGEYAEEDEIYNDIRRGWFE